MSVENKFFVKNGLDANSKNIINVLAPVNNTDAANKEYVDNKQLDDSGVIAGTYGSSTSIPVVSINSKGIITSATTIEVAATSGGDGLTSSNAKNFFFN